MVAFVREWGGGLGGSAADPQPIPVPAAIDAGHTLVLALVVQQVTEAAPTVTDTQGNTWTVDTYVPSAASTTRHVMAHAKITTPLTGADTISVDIASSTTRFAWSVTEWDEPLDVTGSDFQDPANGTVVQSGPVACPADSVLVTGVVLRNVGRNPTPDAGTVLTAKHQSTVGTGDRAIWQQYKIVSAATTTNTGSTLDSSGGYSLTSLALAPAGTEPEDPETPPGWTAATLQQRTSAGWGPLVINEWDGTAWVPAQILQAEQP